MKTATRVLIFVALLCLSAWVISRMSDGEVNSSKPAVAGAEAKTSADPRSDPQTAQREKYVEVLNQSIEPRATARVSGQTLEIKSSYFNDKAVRDQMIARTYGPKTLATLCSIGFKEIRLYATFFGDHTGFLEGDTPAYAVCKETKEGRARAGYAQRKAMAENLSAARAGDFGPNVDAVDVIGTELVLTGPDSTLSVAKAFVSGMDQNALRGACSIGFTGVRVRLTAQSKGYFVSYRCRD